MSAYTQRDTRRHPPISAPTHTHSAGTPRRSKPSQTQHRRPSRVRAARVVAPAPTVTARRLPLRVPAQPNLETPPAVGPVAAPTGAPADTTAVPAPTATVASERHRIASSAAVIMLGGLLSSFLGMIRLEALNALFYGLASGAFTFGLRPIIQASDLLISGLTTGALIPTFVDYSAPDQREELRRVYSTVANLVAIIMTVVLVGLALAAPYFLPLEMRDVAPAGQRLAVSVVRIAALGLLGLGLYAVGSALLYALKEVRYPAFATGIQHVGVVVLGILVLLLALRRAGLPLGDALHTGTGGPALELARAAGARGLATGFAIGAAGEFLLLLPALHRLALHWRPVLDLRHPAVRQIIRLYAPVAIGLAVSVAAQNLELALLGLTPGDPLKNITSYWSAITVMLFPVGLVTAALSLAVLPPLAAAATAGDHATFKRTVVFGFRLGLFLLVPAMVGLLALGQPIMALLFQHGACADDCTARNVLALRNLAYQLPFLALDQILVAAFYARKNTLTPMLVGIASVACYVAVAVPFARTIGLPALAFANAAQNAAHAVILLVLLTLVTGGLGLRALGAALARIAAAAGGMTIVCLSLLALLPRIFSRLFVHGHLTSALMTAALVGTIGALTYFALASALHLDEARLLADLARARLGHFRPGAQGIHRLNASPPSS